MCLANDWNSNEERLRALMGTLDAAARTQLDHAWEGIPSNLRLFGDGIEHIIRFHHHNLGQTDYDTSAAFFLITKTPEDTYHTYALHIKEMGRVSSKSEAECLAQFKRGLDGVEAQRCLSAMAGLQETGERHTLNSLAVHLTALLQYDKPMGRGGHGGRHAAAAGVTAGLVNTEEVAGAGLVAAIQTTPLGAPPVASAAPAGEGCWNCGDPSHRSLGCPQERRNPCWTCGEEGHRARECPKKGTMGRCPRCHTNGHDPSVCRFPKDGKPPGRFGYDAAGQQDFRKGGPTGSAGPQRS